jgi:hypothetical protein
MEIKEQNLCYSEKNKPAGNGTKRNIPSKWKKAATSTTQRQEELNSIKLKVHYVHSKNKIITL